MDNWPADRIFIAGVLYNWPVLSNADRCAIWRSLSKAERVYVLPRIVPVAIFYRQRTAIWRDTWAREVGVVRTIAWEEEEEGIVAEWESHCA